eukprot:1155252-Pelagomonas_calceolata.AAC.3
MLKQGAGGGLISGCLEVVGEAVWFVGLVLTIALALLTLFFYHHRSLKKALYWGSSRSDKAARGLKVL